MKTTRKARESEAGRRYALTDEFFSEAVRNAIRDSLFSPIASSEKEVVRLKPNFSTACWVYLPPHRIYIGKDLFEKDAVKLGLSVELQQKYIENHYHHERAHALFTERDMKRVNKSLKAIDAPFNVFNLFEDALIEHRYRREGDYRFEWLTMENLDFSPRPESLLFALIQAEGSLDVVEQALNEWKPKAPVVEAGQEQDFSMFLSMFAPNPQDTQEALKAKLPRVFEYYQKITSAKGTLFLMPIINAWLDEFGRPPPSPTRNKGMEDLELSSKMMTDAQAADEFDKDAKQVSGGSEGANPDSQLPEESEDGQKQKSDDTYAAESKRGKVLHKASTAVDLTRAQTLAARFSKFFQQTSRVVSTKTPQRRMSARHFALGRAPYRRLELQGRGAKNVFIVIDCSGSMAGSHMMEGKLIITALSILARQGHVTGHIALSAVTDGPSWEVFKLPVAQEVINRIQGYAGAEGLEDTLRDNMKFLQKADYAMVYTDAQICDKPIDKSFFHQHGVYTWGLYVGKEDSYLDELMQYFDKAIMRNTAEALVDAMLAQN